MQLRLYPNGNIAIKQEVVPSEDETKELKSSIELLSRIEYKVPNDANRKLKDSKQLSGRIFGCIGLATLWTRRLVAGCLRSEDWR